MPYDNFDLMQFYSEDWQEIFIGQSGVTQEEIDAILDARKQEKQQ